MCVCVHACMCVDLYVYIACVHAHQHARIHIPMCFVSVAICAPRSAFGMNSKDMQILGRDMVRALRYKALRGKVDGWAPVESLCNYLKQTDETNILACAFANFRHKDGEFRFDRARDADGTLWLRCIDSTVDDADRGAGGLPDADDDENAWGTWSGKNAQEPDVKAEASGEAMLEDELREYSRTSPGECPPQIEEVAARQLAFHRHVKSPLRHRQKTSQSSIACKGSIWRCCSSRSCRVSCRRSSVWKCCSSKSSKRSRRTGRSRNGVGLMMKKATLSQGIARQGGRRSQRWRQKETA